jgi:IMP dehydrogenase/GMP reductase
VSGRVAWSEKVGPEALTFDDVLLVPHLSEVHPRDTDLRTQFTRRIPLNVPIVSAAMDTVTESELAIALAREGGIGVIHKNLPIAGQCSQVDRVKRSESGMIVDPGHAAARSHRSARPMRSWRASTSPACRSRGREAGRDPHQPRPALRGRPPPQGRRRDDA